MNDLGVKIEEVVEQWDMLGLGCGLSPTKRSSWAYGAGDTAQRLSTLDVIEDAKSKEKTLPLVIQNSLISIISNSGVKAMIAPFHLELIHML
jgi:hypothetical protein